MKRYLLLFAFLPLLLFSCKKEQTYAYSGSEMGLLEEGVFTSDQGVVMHITKAPEGVDLTGRRRVMLFYELYAKESGSSFYEVTALDVTDVAIVEPLKSENPNEQELKDALNIVQSWFGAGYLNLCLTYWVDPAKKTEQTFCAYYSIGKAQANLSIRRDGAGEGYFSLNSESRYSFISIPMNPLWNDFSTSGSEILDPQDRSMPLRLTWPFYAMSENTFLEDVILYDAQGTYTPDN